MRPAELTDIPRCAELGRQFYDEGGFVDTLGPFDEKYIKDYLKRIIESPNAVMYMNNHGMAAAIITNSLIAPVLIVQELFWYVEKQHRGGTTAARLFTMIESWAKKRGAKANYMVCMDNMGDTAQRMYKRCGYVPREHIFVKAL
jgi:GNAT superfamily N-acetyltransferase